MIKKHLPRKRRLTVENIAFLSLALFLWTACQHSFQQIHLQGSAQGTYYNIRYYDPKNRNLQQEIDSILAEFDKTASIFDTASIISRINRNERNVELNPDFIKIFNLAVEVCRHSDGDFDITVGQLVNAYGFGTKERKRLSQQELDSLLHCVGIGKARIENNRLRKDVDCLMLDFNAIAQGYSVDLLAAYFDALQIKNYLIDVGGEVIAKGQKPRQSWMVGIEEPPSNKDAERRTMTAVPLCDMALVTSGNYRKYFEEDGKRYGHTISPKSGRPVENKLLSATIMHPQAAVADAYATACMVMGVQKSIDFLKLHPELDAYLIYAQEDTLQVYFTKGFKEILK